MLKNEKTANNEQDEEETSTIFIHMKLERELLCDEEVYPGFQLSVGEVSPAFTATSLIPLLKPLDLSLKV